MKKFISIFVLILVVIGLVLGLVVSCKSIVNKDKEIVKLTQENEDLKNKKYKRRYYFLVDNESGKTEMFTIKKFAKGFKCGGKLRYKHVEGGVILVDTEFTIKEDKIKKELEEFIYNKT